MCTEVLERLSMFGILVFKPLKYLLAHCSWSALSELPIHLKLNLTMGWWYFVVRSDTLEYEN